MDLATIIEAGGQLTVAIVLAVWVMSERRDNAALWTIIESLVRLRLKQFEENSDNVFMELD